MKLDKQVNLYSIDTSFFYTEDERELHRQLMAAKIKRKSLRTDYLKKTKEIDDINKEIKKNINYIQLENISNELNVLYIKRKEFKSIDVKNKKNEFHNQYMEIELQIKDLKKTKKELLDVIEESMPLLRLKDTEEFMNYSKINETIKILKKELKEKIIENHNVQRKITSDFKTKDIIAMFDSSLTRIIGAEPNTFTEDIMIVRVYYYEMFKSIVLNGYEYKGERYSFWSASAGQIRTKKAVFIKEKVLNQYYNTIYCGLSLEKINAPRTKIKDGVEVVECGCNKNKYLAYTALTSSASEKWDEFDIDKAIIVEDFETVVRGKVDYIDYNKYDENNLWEITRKEMDITIPTMDGCGICLDYTGMCRLPWIKGLIVKFPFTDFIKRHRKIEKEQDSGIISQIGKVKDIYGKEYDILKDGIKYIFTKSQFKMWKYYKSWEQYKEYFKKYNCEACKCADDIQEFKNAKISYQPFQSLYDLSDDEIIKIIQHSNNEIETIGNDRNKILKILGATENNLNRNFYQTGLMLYSEMVNDTYSKEIIKLTKKSMVNNARFGKVQIDGTYTFIIPDLYAFSEWLFLHIDNPRGLLEDGQVSCNLFENDEELDLLRSPHLNFSHCINKNVHNEKTKKWFKANGVYTSCHTLMSLELMYDVDGDMSLVVRDKTIIDAAKRIREKNDIVPLYYQLKKAKDDVINNENLYNGMIAAYSGGNIGEVSNSISKIWNNGNITKTELRAISYLTLWNNCVIDYAKTLWLAEKSEEMKVFLKQYTNKKLPHFFVYIKDKDKSEKQVEKPNNSVINRLKYLVSNPKITITAKNCGEFDYTKLLKNKNIDTQTELAINIIKKFKYLNGSKKYFKKDDVEDKHNYANTFIKKEILKICDDVEYVTDVLIKYHYLDAESKNKRTLWDVFGDVIIENIKVNIDLNTIQCDKCGKRISVTNNKIKYCIECAKEIKKQQDKQYYTKKSENRKNRTP